MSTKRVFLVCILAVLISACTRNISPTAAMTNTPIVSQTAIPTIAVNLELTACVAADETVRIRQGPGTDSEVIGALAPGACITILARNTDSSWVYMETADGFTGWVAAWLLTIDGDLSKVSVQRNDSDVLTAEVQSVQLCTNIANLIGSTVACKLEPAHCVFLPEGESGSTVCTDKPYPNHLFQFVVAGEDWSDYNDSCLIFTGLLESHFNGQEGLLQIIGKDRSQVSFCQ